MGNPFDKYAAQEKEHYIESLGAPVILRDLTYEEVEGFLSKSIKGEDANGEPIIDMEVLAESMIAKISLALIEPKMSVEQLKGLKASAQTVFLEIGKIVEKLPSSDATGKSDSQTETSST